MSYSLKTAMLFEKREGGEVICRLCRHTCRLSPNQIGICGVRKNVEGELKSLVFGQLASCNLDPIEKKPLFHFLPGTKSLSIATIGCNMKCSFCQNYSISQASKDKNINKNSAVKKSLFSGNSVSPEFVVSGALENGAKSISYTYSEPTVFFEYAYEISKLASSEGLRSVFVSNGYMTREAIDVISPYLDGINVDLKSFSAETYKKICGADLEGVLDSIRYIKEKKIWIEITTLIVPGMNDTPKEIRDIARFIASVGCEIPWHISRFHPDFKMMDRMPTGVKSLLDAVKIGKEEGLRYIFTGNFYNPGGEDTLCPYCNARVIERRGFSISKMNLEGGNCRFCKKMLDGVYLN